MYIPEKYLTETVILVEAAPKVNDNQLLSILTQSNPFDKDDQNIEYYRAVKTRLHQKRLEINSKGIELDKNKTKIAISDRSLIDKAPQKLQSYYSSIEGLLKTLWELMLSEGKFGQNAEMSNLIQKTTLEILEGLLNMKNPKDDPEDPEEDPEEDPDETPEEPKKDPEPDPEEDENLTASSTRDWTAYKAKKLANPNGKKTSEILDEFYEEYYKIEYAGLKDKEEKDPNGIVDKLKSLNKILIPEFNKLGYNPQANPFAQFLKILIKLKKENKSTIFDKLTINNYGALHNSFIDRHITGNMLGNYSDKTKKTIIFCDDLYNYNGLDIVNYLALQKTVLDAAKADTRYSNDPELIVAKMFIQQSVPEDSSKPFDYKEKVNKLLSPETDAKLPSESGTKMRSWLEISEMVQVVFGVTAKKNLSKKDRDFIIAQAKSQNIILDMVYLLLAQNSFIKDYPSKAEEAEKWLTPKQNTYKHTNENIKKCKDLLKKYMLDSGNIKELVGALMATYDADNKKDKENN